MTLEKMTPRHLPAARRLNGRAVGVSVLLAASMALGGCSLLPSGNQGNQGTEPKPAASTAAPAEQDVAKPPAKPAEPLSAAQELSDKVKASLTKLATVTKAPNREQMLAAMLEAGAVKEQVELSVDITPTGLAVDAVESATRVAEECVIGQVRDGNVAVMVLPVLASGRCFVGDIH
ncbi:DUF6993 domain-containing protein [Arthrobacter glacialis]|nr:hypothetical protein [Arthrobacter glacialis]